MATPTIPNGETQFFVSTYEGNGAGQRVGRFVPFSDNATIANSCIFNSGDSPLLSRTLSGDGNKKIFTISLWIKPCKFTGDYQAILVGGSTGAGTSSAGLYFDASMRIYIYLFGADTLITNRTFEDTSKFYNILIRVDSTDSTADDRVKLYIDGEQETSFATRNNPSINAETTLFNVGSNIFNIGKHTSSNAYYYLDAYIAEVNFVDGQALTPASFGLTDTSTGRWIPKTVSPYPTTTTTFTVTVADASGNKYFIDSSQQATVTLIEGATYRFDQSDSSNAGHPLRFSTTSNGTHSSGVEFTSGVVTAGTPGSSGAYTEITVPTGTATLYYYCTNHSGMGGQANTQDAYGTNGFRLTFSDSSNFGTDTSGKSNTFTATNLSASDQTTSSPTQNFNTFASFNSGTSATDGNLIVSTGTTNGNAQAVAQAGFGVATGKWYWEAKITTVGAGLFGWKDDGSVGGSQASNDATQGGGNFSGALSTGASGQYSAGSWFIDHRYTEEVNYTTVSTNDVLMFAMDLDSGKGYCGKNGTWFNSANPANGTGDIGGCHRANGVNKFYPMAERSDANSVAEYNFGQRSFAHTPPTGFSALQQDNMPETSKGVSGLVWIKDRDATKNHNLFDSSRGKHKELRSNSTDQEFTNADTLQKFLKGGFSIEDGTSVNNSGDSFVSWNWIANERTTATNNDGSITSTVQANTTAGFSIVQFTPGSSAGTVGHGLSQAPEWIIMKDTSRSVLWLIYHKDVGADKYLQFTNAAATSNSTVFSTEPTATTFDPGTGYTSASSYGATVAYCWHSVDGFSKFGTFSGSGSVDGSMIYTGFTPSFLMIKRTDSSTGGNWSIIDSTRYPANPIGAPLLADTTDPESGLSSITMDFLSQGFKIRNTLNSNNASGGSYIFMAFASHPFTGDGVSPVTAR